MLIPCPACGPRETTEFVYMGDASVSRPALDAPAEMWAAAVYDRTNPLGRHQELWHHTYGCRCILRVTRDTGTHAIAGVALVGMDPEGGS
ncbi:MAG: sarcosine oxidase subunit delta [Hyphomicrobiaceae bacterium]